MTEHPLDRDAVYDALCALRDSSAPSSNAVGWAWRAVDAFLRHRCRTARTDAEDVHQRALLKVLRGVENIQADTPAAAERWLRRVHETALIEHHRRLDPVRDALKKAPREPDAAPLIERLAAPDPDRTEADAVRIDALQEAVLDRVERWLSENVRRPSKRVGDFARARAAWMANVLGAEAEAIREALGRDAKRDTLYKWIERGREQVLLPAVTAWEAEAGAAGEDATVPATLREILEGSRRADSGKPRPGRRSVSRDTDGTSVQSKQREPRRGSE